MNDGRTGTWLAVRSGGRRAGLGPRREALRACGAHGSGEGAGLRGGARRPRRLGVLSHPGVSEMELARQAGLQRADEGGARTQKSLLPPGPREPAAPGGFRTREPKIRLKGTTSPLEPRPPQAVHARWHPSAP